MVDIEDLHHRRCKSSISTMETKSLRVNFFFEDKDDSSDLNLAFEEAMRDLGRRHDPQRDN